MSIVKPFGDAMDLRCEDAFTMAGKVVIVTGAAGNIGSGIAEVFAANKANTVLTDLAGDKLTHAADLLRESYGTIAEIPCNVNEPAELKSLVERTVKQFGRLDAIINCAGIPMSGYITDEDVPDFDRMFHTNVRSIWLMTKYAIEPMSASGGGSIVNISSINGHRAAFLCSLYAGTKAAVLAMTKELAVELAPRKIRVNSVSPGTIPARGRIDWLCQQLHEPYSSAFRAEFEPHMAEQMATSQPLTMVGHGHDVGMACYYLCTPAARFVTGEDIRVDGGKHLEMHEGEPRFFNNQPVFFKRVRLHLTGLPEEAWKGEKPRWLRAKPKV